MFSHRTINAGLRRHPRMLRLVVWAIAQVVTVSGLGIAAQAQIVVDNTTFVSGDTTSLTYPHTIGAGSDSLLLVGVEVHAKTEVTSVHWGTGSALCPAACAPDTCLCALTQVATTNDGGKNITVQVWKLVNPPAGSGNVVVTLPSSHRLVSGATSFHGVDHTTPLGPFGARSGEGGTLASSVVASAAGRLVYDAVGTSPDTTLTPTGTGQTMTYHGAVTTGTTNEHVSGAGSLAPGAASVTMSWTLSAANWAIIAVPINPAAIPTGTTHTPTPRATPSPSPTATGVGVRCAGDCNADSAVTVDELLILVNVALGSAQVTACEAGDTNHDGQITIDEILAAVNLALSGCPAR